MKTKPIVMIITFIVMILITPIIFSKLMNSKYNMMFVNLSQNGYKIKTLKENNGYLRSERVLDVVIPGEKLGFNNVKYVEAEVKTYFKNLPITNVYFEGRVINIKLKKENPILEKLAKKIKFNAVTPDFKTYAFKIEPIKYYTLSIDEIKGKLDTKNKIVNFNTNMHLKDKKIVFNLLNLNTLIENKKDFLKNKSNFDINVKLADKDITIKNVNIESMTSFKKDAFINFKLSFKDLLFSKIINANDFYLNVKGYDFNNTLLKKVVVDKDKNLTLNLLANGFKIDINSSLKSLTFLGFNQGGINLFVKIGVDKANDINDFQRNFKKYLSLNIKADMSKKFANMLKNSFPMMRGFLNVPADKNGIVHVRLNFAKGSIK